MEETRGLEPISSNKDFISSLPDGLIHIILSFLDMKLAVQTSVLATRWRYIWTSLPILNIKFTAFDPYVRHANVDDFTGFVDNIFMLRDDSAIQRLHLVWHQEFQESNRDVHCRLNTWLTGCVRRNIQELHLDMRYDLYENLILPSSLFTCKTLTMLELELDWRGSDEEDDRGPDLTLPDLICLPSLKIMKLSDLCISDENETAKLFANCPALESLTISGCHMNFSNVYAPKLKKFIYKNNNYESDEVHIIRLCAPNLTSLEFRSCLTHELDYSALQINSPLVAATITMGVEHDEELEDSSDEAYGCQSTEEKKLYAQNMLKLLTALSTVKDLTLSRWLIKVVSEAPNLVDYQSLQLFNLQSLTLRPFLSKDCLRTITYLLNISPNIVSLDVIINKSPYKPKLYPFCDELNTGSTGAEDEWETGLSLPSMLYHLKSVAIYNVEGRINELKFLEILLRNTKVLEKVVLYCDWENPGIMCRRMRTFCEKLIAFPRVSSHVSFMCF